MLCDRASIRSSGGAVGRDDDRDRPRRGARYHAAARDCSASIVEPEPQALAQRREAQREGDDAVQRACASRGTGRSGRSRRHSASGRGGAACRRSALSGVAVARRGGPAGRRSRECSSGSVVGGVATVRRRSSARPSSERRRRRPGGQAVRARPEQGPGEAGARGARRASAAARDRAAARSRPRRARIARRRAPGRRRCARSASRRSGST